uniref:Uncharacterized protein n=1 Tax=Tanacetum cinerariifolium TaxID=118510 RepID=A0A6L2LWS1_TANCI|nr:hypothetical protein [Tanacetum cinerariifolium]
MANQEQNPPQQEQPFVAAKKKPFTRSPNMYKEYMAEFWYSAKAIENSKVSFSIPTGGIFREVGVNTFRNVVGAHYLPHSSEYVAPPSIDVVRQWFLMIGYREDISAKGTLRKSLIPSSFTPVDTGMHKEDQQATGGLTSLRGTSEERANPQLNSDNSGENKEDKVHLIPNAKTEDTLIPKSSSLSSLPTELKDLPSKFNDLTKKAITSKKTRDDGVPSAGQAGTQPAKGEKNTNHAIISHSFQPGGEHIKEDKGKKALSSEEAEKESTDNDFDDETHVTGSMVEPSRTKKLKKFDFITEDERHIHLTKEEINHEKKLEEDAKAEEAKQEKEVRKAKLVDLLGLKVVKRYYNDKLQYDKYCDEMPNRRVVSRITNYDVLTRKGPITLKVYREDGTSEIIPNFKASDLHLGEWREVMKACPNRTGKGWEIIYK